MLAHKIKITNPQVTTVTVSTASNNNIMIIGGSQITSLRQLPNASRKEISPANSDL